MKILVVGYGSMGRRRIRLLKQCFEGVSFLCVDTNIERLEQIKRDGMNAYQDLSAAISEKPDMAFVCTSPGHHAKIILDLVKAGIPVFTELNLISDRYDEIIKAAEDNGTKVFMSNTMLYDKQILSIMDAAGSNVKKHTYIYHVGQYLPDWHPWESYKDFFIGKKQTNGCREILAIQLPWIIKLFGRVKNLSVIKKKNTTLDIDFEDTYIITVEHENDNSGVFVCDVLARKAVNYLEVMGENTHITWQGTPETLKAFDPKTQEMKALNSYENATHIDGYADIISEDQYLDEIKAFLDWLNEGKEPACSLQDDRYILDLIDEIEGIK